METPHGVHRLESGGVWRMRPETLKAEIFLRGFCNPWGHHYDEYGQSFVTDGAVQMHLTKKDILNSFRSGQTVNPLERGHIAYRTDDIEAFKVHLDDLDVPYSDWGSDAVKGWHQIFFYDPEGNVIEVHQIVNN